jgi:hypothetical protein
MKGLLMFIYLTHIRMIESGRVRLVAGVAFVGGMTDAYSLLVGEPEGKRPL